MFVPLQQIKSHKSLQDLHTLLQNQDIKNETMRLNYDTLNKKKQRQEKDKKIQEIKDQLKSFRTPQKITIKNYSDYKNISSNTQRSILYQDKAEQSKMQQFITHLKDVKWKPQTRENTNFTVVNKQIFMYAGIGISVYMDMNRWDPKTFQWEQLDQKNQVPTCPRYGHSLQSYKEKIYVFGGMLKAKKMKNLTNEINIYNTQNFKWDQTSTNNQMIQPRYNQASCMAGKYLIIHGGNDSKGKQLSDMFAFDIMNQKWQEIPINLPLTFHSIVFCYDPDRKIDSLINYGKQIDTKLVSNIQIEGLYIFRDNLVIKQLDKDQLIAPQTFGKQPQSRYAHAATINFKEHLYVIHGGRTQDKSQYFDDFFILNLINLNWIKVEQYGDSIQKRAGHGCLQTNGKIYIFGGYNQDGYINFDPFIVDQVSKKKDQRKIEDQMNQSNYKMSQRQNMKLPPLGFP